MNMKLLSCGILHALIVLAVLSASAQPEPVVNACALHAALQKLDVTGTVMYVAAHPDDENTALLAYFAAEEKYRTVYLSLTRGEGGQNILGAEKGADLGVIRTEELLAARRVDGAEQRFTRAIDFGFSKTADETIALWTKDSVIADIVWAIRSVRPDVIITRFSPTEGGHGNHTASALLTEAAFKRSGDPSWYPDQLRYVRPWTAKKLFFNRLRGFGNRAFVDDPRDIIIDTGIFNPFLGLSYTEIAGISRSLHKTQAMGSEQRRGANLEYFRLTDEAPIVAGAEGYGALGNRTKQGGGLFAGIDASWKRYPGGASVDRLVQQADKEFDPSHPEKIVTLLARAYAEMRTLGDSPSGMADPVITKKQEEIISAIAAAIGFRCDILSSSSVVLPGEVLHAEAVMIQRSPMPVMLESIAAPALGVEISLHDTLQFNAKKQISIAASIPSSMHPTQPYWLQTLPDQYLYRVPWQRCIGLPENPDSLFLSVTVRVAGERFVMKEPIRFRRIDPIAGELYRPVVILPRLDVSITQKSLLWLGPGMKEISVRLVSNDSSVSGRLMLRSPSGYRMEPLSVPFTLTKAGEERTVVFHAVAESAADTGPVTAVAVLSDGVENASAGSHGTGECREHGADISYPHIVPQYVMHTAQVEAIRADMRISKRRIGIIAGSGDEVPDALRLCGYDVAPIDDDTLQSGTLSGYEAIVVGVRAYNVRTQLQRSNARLMEYVHAGGTLVVQYQIPAKEVESIGPYPFRISRDRVTDETAEMQITPPAADSGSAMSLSSRLMIVPNRLTKEDFDGWVQERGLYFADKWDERYEAPFACHDPNETPTRGSVLIARYGKGVYCYTGLSFFRELPAGVPGAFRLFSNLIELAQTPDKR
jgi:LmbE family N-acetylglucosaminyl deacetylase